MNEKEIWDKYQEHYQRRHATGSADGTWNAYLVAISELRQIGIAPSDAMEDHELYCREMLSTEGRQRISI